MSQPDHQDPSLQTDAFATRSFNGGDAPVTTYMSDGVVKMAPSTSLRAVAQMIAEASVGCILVGEGDTIEGVVSERDIVAAVAAGLDLDATRVDTVESTRLVWASPEATISEVAHEMMEDYVRHILVGRDGRAQGVVSMRDVIAAFTT
jgi:CBS domain-containing protein